MVTATQEDLRTAVDAYVQADLERLYLGELAERLREVDHVIRQLQAERLRRRPLLAP